MKTHLQLEAVCGPKFMSFCDDIGDALWFVYGISFRRFGPLKLPLSCEIVEKVFFAPTICREKGYPRFQTCVFKSHLLPTMWPDMVEFRPASSEIRGRKKKERIQVKHKSGDTYVGRPKI